MAGLVQQVAARTVPVSTVAPPSTTMAMRAARSRFALWRTSSGAFRRVLGHRRLPRERSPLSNSPRFLTRPTSKDTPRGSNRFSVLEVEACTTSDNDSISLPNDESVSPEADRKLYVRSLHPSRSLTIKAQLEELDNHSRVSTTILVDCGATAEFMNEAYVRAHNFRTRQLAHPIPVYNVDGSPNEAGSIREEVDLIVRLGDHSERITFAVCGLGKTDAILGFTWLRKHNPDIDWSKGTVSLIRCPSACHAPLSAGPALSPHSANWPPLLAGTRSHPQRLHPMLTGRALLGAR